MWYLRCGILQPTWTLGSHLGQEVTASDQWVSSVTNLLCHCAVRKSFQLSEPPLPGLPGGFCVHWHALPGWWPFVLPKEKPSFCGTFKLSSNACAFTDHHVHPAICGVRVNDSPHLFYEGEFWNTSLLQACDRLHPDHPTDNEWI